MMATRLSALLLLLLASASTAAQDRPAQSPPFRTESELVVVDAVVVDDRGEPITDLGVRDFVVEEDGRPQPIQFFQPVVTSDVEDPGRPDTLRFGYSTNVGADARPVRSFVLFFDDVHLTQEQGERAKKAFERFLTAEAQPGDLVSLVAPARALRWHARLPDGRADLLEALASLRGGRLPDSSLERISDYEAYRIHVMQDEQMAERIGRRFSNYRVGGREPIDLQRDQGPRPEKKGGAAGLIEPFVQIRAAEAYGRAAARTRATLAALSHTIESMGSVRGRKSLIIMSPGFILDQELSLFQTVEDAARRANIALYFVDARGLEVQSVFGSAQFGSPVDARDLGAANADLTLEAEGAVSLAEMSGGFSVQNSNDLARALGRIGRESSAYYLLGYLPPQSRADGKFRRIRVRVNRPDVQVRARKGYYPAGVPADDSPAAAKTEGGSATADALATAVDSPYDRSELPVRARAYVFGQRSESSTSTLLATEVDLRSFELRAIDGKFTDVIDIHMLVTDSATGETLRHERAVEVALERGAPAAETSAWYPIAQPFDLAPGRYQARIAVRDRNSGRIGSLTHLFEVPARAGLALSSLIVTDAVEQTHQPGQPPRPVLIVRRTLAPGATLYYQFSVFNAARTADGRTQVRAGHTVRGADGTVRKQLTPTPLVPGEHGISRFAGTSLAGLPPGDYELEIEVHDDAGGAKATVREAFTIAPAERR